MKRVLACMMVLASLGPMVGTRAVGEAASGKLPDPPANGTMGFLVDALTYPVVHDPDACPDGLALTVRGTYLAQQTPEERARLSLKENEPELTKRWQASVFGPNGTNICSQPDMFERPMMRTVQSRYGWGLDLDGDQGKGSPEPDSCAQQDFVTPAGEPGIDNQEYRVLGCKEGWRGKEGSPSEYEVGTRQFYASGEWTQVILLRGVDSLQNDPAVEVIYANTPDRPLADSKGKFLRDATFTISDTLPRHRNVLKARIDNGVLTTEPADIALAQTWGQGGARDIRGNRTKHELRKGRLRLTFQTDGSLMGMVGGYRPVFDSLQSPGLGGAGSALTAGIDCAAELRALRHYADGIKDPRTGQCTAVSTAMRITAIPAFVNDVPQRTAAR
jgi:hypothetical protein